MTDFAKSLFLTLLQLVCYQAALHPEAREIRGLRVFAKLQGVTRGYATLAVSIFSGVSLLLRDGKWKPRKSVKII